MEMEQNVLTHYVVDAHGSHLPLIPIPTTTTTTASSSTGEICPLTSSSSSFAGHHAVYSQVQQQHQEGGQNQLETHVTIISFEQCCVCSVMYEQRRPGPVPQPDLNRMVSKVLDVLPEAQFFRTYLPFCVNCTSLLRKFDRLRIELEFVKTQLVTYVVESLIQVRAEGGSQLEGLKAQILNRWTNINSSGESSHKKGFSATSTSAEDKTGDLSWAAYNNLAKSATSVGEPIENWNVDSEVIVEAVNTTVPAFPSEDKGGRGDDNLDETASVSEEDDAIEDPSEAYHDESADPLAGPAIPVEDDEEAVSHKISMPLQMEGRRSLKKGKRRFQGIEQDVTPLICVNCGRIHESVKTYNAHVQVCNSDDLQLEKICTICTEELQRPCIFGTWNDFKTHVLHQHQIVKLEVCQFCRLRLLPFGIKHHKCKQIYKRQLDEEAIFKCDQCGRAYNYRANLTDHVRRSHRDQKHSCDMCGKTYGSPMLLKFHVERHKSVVTKFKCDVCGVCLSSNYSLKEHTKRHTGEQPYDCSICKKKFSSKTIFNAHQMVHSDEKPHKCEKCGKGFKLRGTMRRHLSRHLLYETKYTKKCPICPNSSFRKIWILKKHMKTEHPGTVQMAEVFEKFKNVDDTPPRRPQIVKPGKKSLSEMATPVVKNEVDESETEESQKVPTISVIRKSTSLPEGFGTPSPSRHSARLMRKTYASNRVGGVAVSKANPSGGASDVARR